MAHKYKSIEALKNAHFEIERQAKMLIGGGFDPHMIGGKLRSLSDDLARAIRDAEKEMRDVDD